MIGQVLGAIWGFFQNLFSVVLGAIGDFFGWLLDGLVKILTAIFKPIFILIAIIFYFFYKIAEIFLLLFQVLLAIGKLLYSFVQGLIVTIAGFAWTPTTPEDGSWSHPIREVFKALELFQLDNVAYLLMFAIWIFTALAVIRILSGRR